MSPDGVIYRAPAEEIPKEDSARLEGYLLAREDLEKTLRSADDVDRETRLARRQAATAAERARLADEIRRRDWRRHRCP